MSFGDNWLDQELDIKGSTTVNNTRDLAVDEAGQVGAQVATGNGDTIGGAAPAMTLTDAAALFTSDMVGQFITLSGSTTAANDGEYLITGFTSTSVISYENAAGVAEAFGGTWSVKRPYSLLDDNDFHRTDRLNIKGTASHVTAVPTYDRPTAIGTLVPANLTNIAGKTTDAKALLETRIFQGETVAAGDTDNNVATTDQHADAVDRTGIPLQDGADAASLEAHYVEIVDPTTGKSLLVNGGAVGDITPVAASLLVAGADTDTFTLDDGTNPAVTFVFDDDGTVVETATNRAINHTGVETAAAMRDLMIAAINSAPTLGIDASANGADVHLQNTIPGVAGNVAITETVADAGFIVSGMSGGTATGGSRIFGRTRLATATEGVSVNIEYRQVPLTSPLSASVAYTWEVSQPTTVDYYYSYRERLDNLDEAALKRTLTNGLVGDAAHAIAISDLQSAMGVAPGDADLAGLLTNLTNFFTFSGLDSDPTVVEALNILNEQIGDRNYTGTVLTDGETITASLQALANAIAASSAVTRLIDRLTVAIPPGGTATLPGGNSYVLDGTNNGAGLMCWWRGAIRDPGPLAGGPGVGGNDYLEASTTTISPYRRIRIRDHINYLIIS